MVQQVLLPLWNAYTFFVTYANLDNWSPVPDVPSASEDPLDRWILARLYDTVRRVTASLDDYQLDEYAAPLMAFVDDLTNWYIRRSRRRFWSEGMDAAKAQAYQTLYHVLTTYARLLAPAAPFISEEIYRNLTGEDSVHLAPWPELDDAFRDEGIIARMDIGAKNHHPGAVAARPATAESSPAARKVECVLPPELAARLTPEELALVADELNVKQVVLVAGCARHCRAALSARFKRLGPLLGADMPVVRSAIRAGQFTIEQHEAARSRRGPKSGRLTPRWSLPAMRGKEGRVVAGDWGIVVYAGHRADR